MTQPIIKPTVGRVVLFHPSKNAVDPGFSRHAEGEPYAAIVAHVHGDTMVNLSVFDANGVTHSRTSVTLVQGDADAPAYGFYAEWMPFQKGQAAKTEAIKKTAGAQAPNEYRQPTQREQLEYALVSGAASHLAQRPTQAGQIAHGIKTVLDALHPRDVACDPQATLCVKPGEPLKAAPITLPVIDPGPDSLEREIQANASNGPRVTPADIEAEIGAEYSFTVDKALAGCPLAEGLDRVTVSVIVLKNGAKVVGINYGAIDPAQHSAERGRQEARAQAVDKVYELLGFRLRDKLACAPRFSSYVNTLPPAVPLDIGSDKPLSGACDLSSDAPCEACQ